MVEFDSKYADWLTVQADELLKSAQVVPARVPSPPRPMSNPPHPVLVVSRQHIIGEISSFEALQDGEGTECGRFWTAGNSRIGWEGDAYKKIRGVASKLSSEKPLGEYISMRFALDETFAWLRGALEKKQDLPFAEYLKKRCEEELFRGEIWIPLCHTYANYPFAIGEVTFKAVHKSMMDIWYSQVNAPADPDIRAALNRERSALQAKLAGCVEVCAEPLKALDIALNKVRDAAALLRFLSHANWSCKIRSEAVPDGTQLQVNLNSLSVVEGTIKYITRGLTESLPRPWNVTENIKLMPNVLAGLHDLAKNNSGTELRKSLFESLLIYSRNNLTTDLSEKLLFVLVALEALLLRDGSEAIQGNLAERLAFLAGPTLQDRKAIVASTRKIYKLRSNFVHHGKSIEDVDTLEHFLQYAWNALASVLANVDRFPTRQDLVLSLDDRRLA